MPQPYDRTTHDGKTVDWLTKAALMAAEAELGYELSITQGSYNAGGVAQSAGTHDLGGVVDLRAWDWENKVRVLRKVGFAAWHRTPSQGPWPEHCHAVLIGNEKLAPSASRQVTAYLDGRNGLANNGTDDGPRDFVNNRFRWADYLESQKLHRPPNVEKSMEYARQVRDNSEPGTRLQRTARKVLRLWRGIPER